MGFGFPAQIRFLFSMPEMGFGFGVNGLCVLEFSRPKMGFGSQPNMGNYQGSQIR
jgi:hypothetical protein